MLTSIKNKIVCVYNDIKQQRDKMLFKPLYRLVEIIEENDEYTVVIKIIQKNVTFKVKPEEILANDELVDQFSPRDIRALTYLGYLGINSPKYKVLAKQFSESNRVTFVIRKKGEKGLLNKTAAELSSQISVLNEMKSIDAHVVGYMAAIESLASEAEQKKLASVAKQGGVDERI